MKVRAKTNVNVGGVWYAAGDVFETDSIGELTGLAEAVETEEQASPAPAPAAPEPGQKPKKTTRRKAGK